MPTARDPGNGPEVVAMPRDVETVTDPDPSPGDPGFEDERGARRSQWLALGLAAVLGLWMGSGFVFPSETSAPETASDAVSTPAVAVRASTAGTIEEFLQAEGQTEAERETGIPAQAAGEIAELAVRRGATMAAGEIIARIAPGERSATLEQARAELARARREFDNAETLLERGVATADRLAQTRSALAAAEAQVAAAEEAMADLVIRAPFEGRIEALEVQPGEFVQPGVSVARIVDLSPLAVRIRLPQQAADTIAEGLPARVTFITGQEREGTVIFVGRSADPATRTFEAEVEVANPDGEIPAGISAEVRIPTGETRGHFVSPAVLSLDTSGRLGVKTVTEEGTVAFHEVRIVRAQTDGVWIAGLPETARIITVGQGFVSEGEAVEAREEGTLNIGQVRDRAAPAGAGP